MKTQVFLTCCVVVLMAAHAVLADDPVLAECYETSNGARFEVKHISADMEACFTDALGTSDAADTPCGCAAAAEARGMNSFKFGGSCLLYRVLAEDDSSSTTTVYSVTSAPFTPGGHVFHFEMEPGIPSLNLRSVAIRWMLDDPCGVVKEMTSQNMVVGVGPWGELESYDLSTGVRVTQLVSPNMCLVDGIVYTFIDEFGDNVIPDVTWLNPRRSDYFGDRMGDANTIQLYNGADGDARCFLQTGFFADKNQAMTTCSDTGGFLYGDGYENDDFKDRVIIFQPIWIAMESSDGITYTWASGVSAPYSAETWITQGTVDKLCVYIGDRSSEDKFMFGVNACTVERRYQIACTNYRAK